MMQQQNFPFTIFINKATIPRCGGCHELILDRFILKVLERTWHAKCLQCNECHVQLTEKCFARNGLLFCKEDFFKYVNNQLETFHHLFLFVFCFFFLGRFLLSANENVMWMVDGCNEKHVS